MIQTPWAVLRCKFKDDASEPYGRQRYDDLFTSSGVGKLNMVDFFRDMSHGQLDLSGSRVFGWYTLDMNRSAYLAGLVPGLTKEEIYEAARAEEAKGNHYAFCLEDLWKHGAPRSRSLIH